MIPKLPPTVKNPGAGAIGSPGRITNSGMASQSPGRVTNSGMASQSPAQPEAQQQNGDVPQWMKNYASYQNNGTPAPTTSNSYQTAAPAGDTSQGGGYQIIMVVMIGRRGCLWLPHINKDKARAHAATRSGYAGCEQSSLSFNKHADSKLQHCAKLLPYNRQTKYHNLIRLRHRFKGQPLPQGQQSLIPTNLNPLQAPPIQLEQPIRVAPPTQVERPICSVQPTQPERLILLELQAELQQQPLTRMPRREQRQEQRRERFLANS